jgi:hypothetical protein
LSRHWWNWGSKRTPATSVLENEFSCFPQLLWTRALNNDSDAVRLLLNRLPPQAIPPPEPEPPHKVTDPYEDLIVVLKALVKANVIPAKYFEIFQKNEQDPLVQ